MLLRFQVKIVRNDWYHHGAIDDLKKRFHLDEAGGARGLSEAGTNEDLHSFL